MEITVNTKKSVNLTNEIKVGDIVVVGQNASIDSDTNQLNLSHWINRMDLYEEHYTTVREAMNEFEQTAFAEKNKMVEEGAE